MRWLKKHQMPVGLVFVLIIVTGVLVATALVGLQPWSSEESVASASAKLSAVEQHGSREVPGFLYSPGDSPAPPFELQDQNANLVSLQSLQGKWLVIDWIYTTCVTVCPALTAEMKMVQNGLGDKLGREVQFVSISFDPKRDTVDVLKSYSQNLGGDTPGWSWLTGTQKDTDAIADAYGLIYEPARGIENLGHFEHTPLVVVVDPDGLERHRYMGTGWSQDLLTRLQADLISYADDLGGSILAEKIGVPQESTSAEAAPKTAVDSSPAIPANDSASVAPPGVDAVEALRSEAREFPWNSTGGFDDIDSELILQFNSKYVASDWIHAQTAQSVSAGWTVLESEPEDSQGFAYTLLEGPDGTYLGMARELWVALEVKGTNPQRVYAMLFYAEGLCCLF